MVAPPNKLEIVQRFYRAALEEDEEERLRSNRNSRSRRRFRRAVAQRAASERLWREILAHGDHASLAACTYDVEQLVGIDLGELAYDREFLQLLGRAFVEIARTKRARDRGDFFGEAADPLFRASFDDAALMEQSATEEGRCPSADTPRASYWLAKRPDSPRWQLCRYDGERRKVVMSSTRTQDRAAAERLLAERLATAARRDAVLDLTWDAVDLRAGIINLNPRGRIQTSKHRPIVRMNDALRAALLEAEESGAPTG